jgi:hypothetical protein
MAELLLTVGMLQQSSELTRLSQILPSALLVGEASKAKAVKLK